MRALGVSAVLIGTLVLAGCGGGGGDGPQGTLTLSPTTLTFTTNDLAQAPASQFVNATINTTRAARFICGSFQPVQPLRTSTTCSTPVRQRDKAQACRHPCVSRAWPSYQYDHGDRLHERSDVFVRHIGSPQTVAVTYNITGVTSTSSAVSYTLSMTPVTADYTKTLPVVAYPTFTAASSVNWLSVAPSTGGSGTSNLR